MKNFVTWILTGASLTGCGGIQETFRSLEDNRAAIDRSTCVIEENIQAIEAANQKIEENRRQLEAINASLKKAGEQ